MAHRFGPHHERVEQLAARLAAATPLQWATAGRAAWDQRYACLDAAADPHPQQGLGAARARAVARYGNELWRGEGFSWRPADAPYDVAMSDSSLGRAFAANTLLDCLVDALLMAASPRTFEPDAVGRLGHPWRMAGVDLAGTILADPDPGPPVRAADLADLVARLTSASTQQMRVLMHDAGLPTDRGDALEAARVTGPEVDAVARATETIAASPGGAGATSPDGTSGRETLRAIVQQLAATTLVRDRLGPAEVTRWLAPLVHAGLMDADLLPGTPPAPRARAVEEIQNMDLSRLLDLIDGFAADPTPAARRAALEELVLRDEAVPDPMPLRRNRWTGRGSVHLPETEPTGTGGQADAAYQFTVCVAGYSLAPEQLDQPLGDAHAHMADRIAGQWGSGAPLGARHATGWRRGGVEVRLVTTDGVDLEVRTSSPAPVTS